MLELVLAVEVDCVLEPVLVEALVLVVEVVLFVVFFEGSLGSSSGEM